jgi:hypothetical protein
MRNVVRKGTQGWTPEEDAKLETLILNGVHYAEVGRLLGRTTASVEQRRYLLKLPTQAQVKERRIS